MSRILKVIRSKDIHLENLVTTSKFTGNVVIGEGTYITISAGFGVIKKVPDYAVVVGNLGVN